MKVVLLGSGGYFPTHRRHTACLILPEVGAVLDAGTGMCGLARYVQSEHLDIFLSHAHLDHIAGLTYLLNLVPAAILAKTTVHGDAAKLAAVREHLFAPDIFPVAPAFRFAELTSSCKLPNGGKLEAFPLQHPGGSLGFRLDWPGHSLAYVTDTTATPDADYVDRIRGVDLLVHEAYFADDAAGLALRTGHSSLPNVVAVAAKANVGRLVISHLDPMIDTEPPFDLTLAKNVFPNVSLGHDGRELEF